MTYPFVRWRRASLAPQITQRFTPLFMRKIVRQVAQHIHHDSMRILIHQRPIGVGT
jgi:hypothetical protein